MKTPAFRPTVPDVLPLVAALYEKSGVGCCLHIAVDDYNVDDASVDFCIEGARRQGHLDCLALALLLRTMSRTQRLSAAHYDPLK